MKTVTGKAISDLPMGNYDVQEIKTNAAYITSDTKYPVIFEYAGQETAMSHHSKRGQSHQK